MKYQRIYDTNAEFALKVRLLSALAFISVISVVETFEYLIENEIFPGELQSVVDFFWRDMDRVAV